MSIIRLKKGEDRRIRQGHPWVYSNEIATSMTPIKNFQPGQEVMVVAHDQSQLGLGYINPHSLICVRIFSRDVQQHLDSKLFQQRLHQALQLRDKLFSKPYYRLAFSEGDNLPGLIVDRFGDHLVAQLNTAGIDNRKEMICDALLSLLPETKSILLRNDTSTREYEGLEKNILSYFGEVPETIELVENEVSFSLPLLQGQKTGWFFDHRINRLRLQNYVKDKNVLDVFSYLGAWGIQAACAGAKNVECIDSSALACDYIKNNAKLNRVADRINVICEDAFTALKNLQQNQKKYDVIILDPPAFVKKFKDREAGLLAYQRLNEIALKLLVENGILVTCSCSMHVTPEDFMTLLQRVAYRTKVNLQILERGHQGPDHPIHPSIPETDYLKMCIVRKLA